MSIRYEGIGNMGVTIPAGDCKEGHVCGVDTSGKACLCAQGAAFIGKVETVHGNQAGVQVFGFAKVPYTGIAPAMGYSKLSANGTGGVMADTAGNAYWVVEVDTTGLTVTIKL